MYDFMDAPHPPLFSLSGFLFWLFVLGFFDLLVMFFGLLFFAFVLIFFAALVSHCSLLFLGESFPRRGWRRYVVNYRFAGFDWLETGTTRLCFNLHLSARADCILRAECEGFFHSRLIAWRTCRCPGMLP
jgi:hypothetical protein